ncbi:unnamed protein product [Tenebrio molitor]|nr:unnamed protein product [Tenebrio molitor]
MFIYKNFSKEKPCIKFYFFNDISSGIHCGVNNNVDDQSKFFWTLKQSPEILNFKNYKKTVFY